ncbi:FAD-binding oxidoreductase [Aureimonas fodinaquatilis]|uniref:FAD-binding oxidoreductase n=1 Tax=Aureimonas fodinaquatilis TaxID=2565783 RepID=A0A5B0E305_9HYPH|nr:FAD-binding oxidoreductase [Aureimonas fodinaquatilis]KAA0971809.1 FAD-binding oxidoreductase [Aureimonas fodinaquatilis]
MSDALYQSPISPGRSWYEDSLIRPRWPQLSGSISCDVLVVGGGFTGVSAAAHLAMAGVDAVLLEGARLGDGASGRNGGQMGTGQRLWPEELEASFGYERAKALFDIAEDAKQHLVDFTNRHGIEADLQAGQLSVAHKRRFLKPYQEHAEILATRFNYDKVSFHDRAGMADLLGSDCYYGGLRDSGTYHLNPLKLLTGTAAVAGSAGARLFEQTPVTALTEQGGRIVAQTPYGTVTAARVLVATNAHGGDIDAIAASHVMPIRSFIVATEPLAEPHRIIPGNESVDDSRFVVRYFRKSPDNCLLFGGREAYMPETGNIGATILKQIRDIYPHLKDVGFTHAWGGSVGITMTRMPYVSATRSGITYIGGFSGHGVMLSNFFGRLYAETVTGGPNRLQVLQDLDIPAFPGGQWLRTPLLFLAMTWFALRDRI